MVAASTVAASAAAGIWSWRNHAMLNYGDAVAHLHIARRVIDAHEPGLSQLGSVWLPMPHLLMIPFVAVYAWWAERRCGLDPVCAGLHCFMRRDVPACASLAAAAGGNHWACVLRTQSESPVSADDRNDRAAVSLRDDLALGVAGGMARGDGERSPTSSAAAALHCVGTGHGGVYAV